MSNSNRNGSGKCGNGNSGNSGTARNKSKGHCKLSAQQIAVIAGLLANALQVESVLFNRDQTIEIVLSGSLRRKTKADRIVEEMSGMSVGELLNAFLQR